MRIKILVAIASTAALAACTSAYYRMTGQPTFDPQKPQVYVVQGTSQLYLVVDQEPIAFPSTDPGNPNKKVKIKWHVNDSKYKFETDGIKFTSGNNNLLSGCVPDSSSDSDFGCDNDTSVQGSAKYTITVKPKNSGDPTPPPLDPTIVNG